MRLYIKLIVLMGAAFVLSTIIIVAILGALQEKYLRPNFAQEFQAVTDELAPVLAGKTAEQAQAEIDRQPLNFRARVVALDEEPELLGYRPGGADFRVMFEPDKRRFALFQQQQGGYFIFALMLTAIVVAITAFMITYPWVRRLKKQEKIVGRIAEGDLNARVDERGKDVLGLLGRRINQMADRISSLLDNQRHLLHAVSHEMRTPVARIGFGIEMIEEAANDDERQRRIAALHDDLDEMDALLDELLTFLRVDSGSEAMEKTSVDMAIMVGELIGKTQRLFPDIVFENKLPPHVQIQASDRYLPRALENLVRNAARHASSRVQVSCRMDGKTVVLEVHDDGKGVPVPDRDKIFDAFTRLDRSRTKKTGDGAGLGLAICERIIRMHGGRTCVDDSPLGRALFVVELSKF